MCASCMAGAATAAAGATGIRVWLQHRAFGWLTPVRLRRITVALIVLALIVASVGRST